MMLFSFCSTSAHQSSGARHNDVNDVLPETHRSARRKACVWSLDTYSNLSPINNLCVLFDEIS